MEINNEKISMVGRLGKYLKACFDGCGCDDLPSPITRKEKLLYELAEKIAQGGTPKKPYADTTKLTSLRSFCQGGNNLAFVQDENFDSSNVRNFDAFFQGCSQLVTAPALDYSRASSMGFTFEDCINLKTIPNINASSCWGFSQTFKGCAALENITFTEGTIQTGIDFTPCVNLTNESLLSILKGIRLTQGYQTMKLPANKEAVITGDEEMNEQLEKIKAAHWTVIFA